MLPSVGEIAPPRKISIKLLDYASQIMLKQHVYFAIGYAKVREIPTNANGSFPC